MRVRSSFNGAVAALVLGAIVSALVLTRAEASPLASVEQPSLQGLAPVPGGEETIGAVCAPDRATDIALRPTGVAADGVGGFYAADVVHSVVCHVSPDGTVETAAGTGAAGYLPAPYGDEVAADAAMLFDPYGLSVDGAGNLFIADRGNHRIRRVDFASGMISTVAGNGTAGSAGDGGAATAASLRAPSDVAVGPAGELYIADSQNHLVRVVSPDGVIRTIAGTGRAGSGGDGGSALSASLNRPTGLAVDGAGRVYIAELGSHRVRVVQSGQIASVAGTGQKGLGPVPGVATAVRLNGPGGLALDAGGNLLIADAGNSRILRVVNGIAVPLAGSGVTGYAGDGGPAAAASLSWPVAVTVDPVGDRILIADNGTTNRIRAVSAGGTITSVAGNGSPGSSGDGHRGDQAELNQPMAVAASPDGTVWVAEAQNDAVRRIGPDGIVSTFVGPAAGLDFPAGLAVAANGDLLIADAWRNRVLQITPAGAIRVIAGTGTATTGHATLGDSGRATMATLRQPVGIALDAAGNLFIADSGNRRVRKVSPDGIISTVAGSGAQPGADPATTGDGGSALAAALDTPTGIAVDRVTGDLFIADPANQRIRRVAGRTGVITTVAGTGLIGFTPDGVSGTATRFNFPRGIVLDGAGLLVADSGNCIVRRIDLLTNRVTTTAGWTPARGLRPTCGSVGASGTGMLNLPSALAIDARGRLLVADSLNHRVRVVAR